MNPYPNYIVFDTETTALPKNGDFTGVHIVQASALVIINNEIFTNYNAHININPQTQPMDPEAEKIHGLSPRKLQEIGRDGAEVVNELFSLFLTMYPSIPLVGQNILGFDIPVLQSQAFHYRKKPWAGRAIVNREGPILDTKLIWQLRPQKPTPYDPSNLAATTRVARYARKSSLDHIATALAVPGRKSGEHDGLEDCYLTHKVFQAMQNQGIVDATIVP